MTGILIADDEQLERAVLIKILRKNLGDRCEILEARNGREVLQLYREKKPQVLILDIEMPGISGIEAAMEIRKTDHECGIIFLTAFDEFSYAKKAITVRALDYLLKPFDEKELMLVTEEAVHRAELRGAETRENGAAAAGVTKRGADTETGAAQPETEETAAVRPGRLAEIMLDYIRQHYHEEISMQDAARELNYSEAYFSKLFRQCFGKNFTAYLMEYRIAAAKKLLGSSAVNVREAGRAVGYPDANYFAKVFKRATGMTPKEYRNSL